MTPLADRSTGEQWPELEPCAGCGARASGGIVALSTTRALDGKFSAHCERWNFCDSASQYAATREEAARLWNDAQRAARERARAAS